MGGDSVSSSICSSDDEPSPNLNFQGELITCSDSSGEDEKGLGQLDGGMLFNGDSGLISPREFPNLDPKKDSIIDAEGRQRCKLYADVLRSYEDLQSRIDEFDKAKNKILSYTPGSWAEKVCGINSADYEVPNITSLLLIGPKGSGKSSLVNKVSQTLEGGVSSSERAQVSSGGTYFTHQYMIPRDSGSFCLYDTRGLSEDDCENQKMLRSWMTKGVRHGKLVKRESDCADLKAQLKYKAQRSLSFKPAMSRAINYVIFVVNGLSVLESMDNDNDIKGKYSQLVARTFSNPLLSYKDDKPVVVVTHGDLMSVNERVTVRVHLGELLGIPPTKQIFDIPEGDNDLAIVRMLTFCLEHAERNLRPKLIVNKKFEYFLAVLFIVFTMCGCITLILLHCFPDGQPSLASSPETKDMGWDKIGQQEVDWHEIRYIW